MSAERITVAGARPLPTEPLSSVGRLGNGSFLSAVQRADSTAVPTKAITETTHNQGETKPKFDPYNENHSWTPDNWIKEDDSKFFGENGFELSDLLDIINPLQHLPVISSIYRSLTGDDISAGARLTGGAIFGGPIGFASALVSSFVEDVNDTTLGDVVIAAFTKGDEDKTDAELSKSSSQTNSHSGDAVAAGATAALMPQASLPHVTTKPTLTKSETRQSVQSHSLLAALEKPRPTPLAFARDLLESPKTGIIGASANATKSIIEADEAMRGQPNMPDPVSAILAARSQVPSSSSIPDLAPYRSSLQVSAPNTAQELKQAALPSNDLKPLRVAKNPPGGAPLSFEPGKRGVPPPRGPFATNSIGRRQAAASAAVPNAMVPKAMISALDKYESMVRSRNNSSNDDLTR